MSQRVLMVIGLKEIRLRALLVSLFCAVQVGFASDIAVVSSPEFRHPPSAAHVRAIVREAATEFHISESALPNMLVVFLTRAEADLQRLPKGRTVADKITREDAVLYYVWIIDDPTDSAVADAVVTIVEHEAKTHRSPDELAAVASRVCKRLKSKVSVAEMQKVP